MRDFAFGQAVLAGFDLLRRRPLATLGLALVGVVASLAGGLTSVASTYLIMATPSRPATPAVISMVATFANLLAFLVAMSIIAAAVMRAIGDGEPDGRGRRFGGDEARLFVLSLLTLPALFAVGLAFGVGSALMVLNRPGVTGISVLTALLTMISATAVFGLASRLWLAGPMTAGDGRFRFMASWRLTRGRSWKVFGAFLVTLLMAVGVGVLGNVVLTKVISGLKLTAELTYGPTLALAMMQVIQPTRLVHALLQGLLLGLAVVIQVAPAAYIHRRLAGDPVTDQAAVFD
ncbi:hypothetical protein PMI01_01060 [Caulobacter sp. AP07]|uniref:hypothetical protein n=1 Tax=Caulobacter sp. AP07 TaxID=1144304 RepID=UPI000271DE5F|nr:hypothetical protein [Caulobacter sp. AP07]EJL36214.1 hypothetical protein PMI01_01060 [Caulobacter sp. AP07]